MFSEDYEQELLKQHRETYAKMLKLVEAQAQKPPFIQQKMCLSIMTASL